MKTIILAAGMGTRIGKMTETIPKCLLPFNGSTILESSISKLKKLNIKDIKIVVGYKKELIKKYILILLQITNTVLHNLPIL